MSVFAIVLAAGRGERMGPDVPDKLWADLCGQPVLVHTLRAFERAPEVDGTVLVLRPDRLDDGRALAGVHNLRKIVAVVAGGARRQDSVAAGLAAMPPAAELAIVHDGARPLLDPETIATGVRLAREHGAAVPGIPAVDTIKRVGPDGLVLETPPRHELWAVQTPQTFRVDLLRWAHALTDGEVTDDAVLVEQLGHPVVVYPGSRRNLKITTADDLAIATALLARGDTR